MSAPSIWEQVLGRIEAKVGRHSFHTWFKPTSLLPDDGARVSVRVPNLLFTEWLPKHYSVVLAEALKDVGRPNTELVFVPEEAKGNGAAAPPARCRPPPDDDTGPAVDAPLPASTPATPSTPSSSDPRISLRMRRAARSPKRRRARTTRCSSTAAWGSARRT